MTPGAGIPAYRFYFLDANDRVFEARDVTCSDDDRAEELARSVIAADPSVHAIETWLRPRLVCRVDGDGARADAKALKARRC